MCLCVRAIAKKKRDLLWLRRFAFLTARWLGITAAGPAAPEEPVRRSLLPREARQRVEKRLPPRGASLSSA